MSRMLWLLVLSACFTGSSTPAAKPPPAASFSLTASEVLRGLPMTLTADDLPEGVTVYFVRESTQHGPPCPAVLQGACFDLAGIQVLGSATVVLGRAQLHKTVPASAPMGLPLRFQAAWMSPLGPDFSTLAGTIVGNPGDGHTGDTSETGDTSDTDDIDPIPVPVDPVPVDTDLVPVDTDPS